MTTGDEHADETDGEGDEEGEPPYSGLDEETAARCGLWLEDG